MIEKIYKLRKFINNCLNYLKLLLNYTHLFMERMY